MDMRDLMALRATLVKTRVELIATYGVSPETEESIDAAVNALRFLIDDVNVEIANASVRKPHHVAA